MSGSVDVVGQLGAWQRRVEALRDQRLELRLASLVDGDLGAQLRAHRAHLVLNRRRCAGFSSAASWYSTSASSNLPIDGQPAGAREMILRGAKLRLFERGAA